VQQPPPVVQGNKVPVAAPPTPSTRPAYPDPTSLAEAQRIVREKYAKQIQAASDPQKIMDLARMFLLLASSPGIAPPEKVATLLLARDLAASALDAKTACEAIQGLQEYAVDVLSMKFSVLQAISQSINSGGAEGFFQCLHAVTEDAVAADNYEVAKRLASLEVAVLQRAGDDKKAESASARLLEIQKTEGYCLQAKGAIGALANGGQDPGDYLAAGKFYCFAKRDWSKGLPMLAKGSDPTFKALAEQEQGSVSDSGKQIVLADGWWAAGEKEPQTVQTAIRQHAAQWYLKALPALAGAERTRVDERLSDSAKSIPFVPPGATVKPSDGVVATTAPGNVPTPSEDVDASICVELRIIPLSADDFKKLEIGSSVVVQGTVDKVAFADSKVEISLKFCRIVEYSLPGKELKPTGLTLPSPKEVCGIFKTQFGKNLGGKAWSDFLKKQNAGLKGKRVIWQVPVDSKVDKTDEIASLQADLREQGKSLAEVKKPRMRTEYRAEWREGQFIHPATQVEVPMEKTAWEKEQIQSLETKMQGLNKLISEKKTSQLVINPIDGETGNIVNDNPKRHKPESHDPGRGPSGDPGDPG
jgi:hypothetical protein